MSDDQQSEGPGAAPEPSHPFTLAVDIGGTGLKASVLGAQGTMVADRVKVATTYPMSTDKLVGALTKLVGRSSRRRTSPPRPVRAAPSTTSWPSSGRASIWPRR
jgi:hypothetical protein